MDEAPQLKLSKDNLGKNAIHNVTQRNARTTTRHPFSYLELYPLHKLLCPANFFEIFILPTKQKRQGF